MAASIKTILPLMKQVSKTTLAVKKNIEDTEIFLHQHKRSLTSTTGKENFSSATDYCAQLVKKHDFESYLCTLLQSSTHRTSVMALNAFNVELAQVQDVTSDKMRATMRMQFWKDAVEHIYKGHPPQTPVAVEIARAVSKHNLSKHWFTKLITARAKQIESDTHRVMSDAEDHAENTVSTLMYLCLECAGVKDVNADHAASHLGRAKGLVTMLRGLPFHASRRCVYLPRELLIKHKVSEEDIFRGSQEQKVCDVMFDVASVSHQHLDLARKLKKDIPKAALPLFLNSVICDNYLKQLQNVEFNVFHKSLQMKNGLLPWQLFMNKMKKTF